MCNLSENIIEKERLNAIERMLKAGATREQILSYGYTEEEFTKWNIPSASAFDPLF